MLCEAETNKSACYSEVTERNNMKLHPWTAGILMYVCMPF